jgi:hypothetical protein
MLVPKNKGRGESAPPIIIPHRPPAGNRFPNRKRKLLGYKSPIICLGKKNP